MDLINIVSPKFYKYNSSNDRSMNFNKFRQFPGIMVEQLTSLTSYQRLIFTICVLILLSFSIVGNIATFFVNVKRKIRPFFRACLLSLACSDLLTSIFTSTAYLSQFSSKFIQIWRLGSLMCDLLPFVTTTTILVNSMTLVGIALDRYMAVMRLAPSPAVMKLTRGTWEPGGLFCSTCIILIWGLSAGIASPMISSYATYDVFIIINEPKNSTNYTFEQVQMCYADKNLNSYYYVVVFSIVFVPTLIAFIWLNSVIAHEIWIRRRALDLMYKTPPSSTSTITHNTKSTNPSYAKDKRLARINCGDGTTMSSVSKSIPSGYHIKNQQNSRKLFSKTIQQKQLKSNVQLQRTPRETRQLRMFTIIFILVGIFILCRLPTWIFLLMKLYHHYNLEVHWILHFSFGILSLSNCVLNPLFYTFLTETIQYTLVVTKNVRNYFGLRRFCTFSKCRDIPDGAKSKTIPEGNSCNAEIYTIFKDK